MGGKVSPHGRDLIIWMVVFTVVNLVVLALRFYTLWTVKRRHLRADDYLIVLSVAAMLAMEGTTFWAIHHGLGARTATLDFYPDIEVNIKLLVSAFWTWTIATCACKMAVLFMYLEIFSIHRQFRKAVWVLMGLCVAYVPTFITVFMTQCSPVSAAWDPVLSLTNCRPREVHETVSVAINVFLDLLVVIAPIPMVWSLRINTRKKIAVISMFSLGLGVIGIMIWRLVTTVLPNDNPDLVYDTYLLALQSHLELWLGVLAANLPTLAPLFNSILKSSKLTSYFSYFKGSGNGYSNNTPRANVGLRTFGGGRSSRRTDRDEFDLLEDESEAKFNVGGISKRSDFTVSVAQTQLDSASHQGSDHHETVVYPQRPANVV